MLADIREDGPQARGYELRSVGADGFHGATFHRFLAKRLFLGTFGLLVNVGVAAVVVSFVIGWRSLAAEIAIDALIIDVVRSPYIFRILVCWVSHISPAKSEMERREKALRRNGNLPPVKN